MTSVFIIVLYIFISLNILLVWHIFETFYLNIYIDSYLPFCNANRIIVIAIIFNGEQQHKQLLRENMLCKNEKQQL